MASFGVFVLLVEFFFFFEVTCGADYFFVTCGVERAAVSLGAGNTPPLTPAAHHPN